MKDAGYTLAEALAGLAILGLATGGLGSVVHLISRQQLTENTTLSELRERRHAAELLTDLVDKQGPFRNSPADSFRGDQDGFSFACGVAQTCSAKILSAGHSAQLVVHFSRGEEAKQSLSPAQLSFVYVGTQGLSEVWPPPGSGAQSLQTIGLRRGDDARGDVIETVKLWTQEERSCQFDVISRDCRGPAS